MQTQCEALYPCSTLYHRAVLDYIFTCLEQMVKMSTLSKEDWESLTDVFTDAEISNQFGFSRTAATYMRKKHNVMSFSEKTGKRKYKDFYPIKPESKRAFSYRKSGADENYFSSLTAPRKAYWLGLLAADGWIITEYQIPTGFAIALKNEDSYLLKQFAVDLGCPSMYRKEREEGNLWQIKLTSSKAAEDLIKLGIVPKKSKILQLPNLPFNLLTHWLRGYFDGDGSVSVRENTLSAKITSGSKSILICIKGLLFKQGIKASITKDGDAYNLCVYTKNALKFASIIYKDFDIDNICLIRKKQIFDQFKVKV